MNQKLVEKMREVLSPQKLSPITNREFDRRMFLETFITYGGIGVPISKEEVMDYCVSQSRSFCFIV